jgi:hypothetical protein
MKTDDFEKQLQRQPLRSVPEEWRDQILSAAARHCDHAAGSAERATRRSWLRELLWPSPYAWGGLAAVWLIVLGLNFTTARPGSSSGRVATAKPVHRLPDTLLALEQHLRLHADLTATNELVEPPKSLLNRPRTARRLETVAA